jgi:hypothetical protein
MLYSCEDPKPEIMDKSKDVPDSVPVQNTQKDPGGFEIVDREVEVTLVSYEKPRPQTFPIMDSSGVIRVPKCRTKKVLNPKQFKQLEEVLNSYPYNGGPICVGNPIHGYFPMHCILYKDKKSGEFFDYLELYFENYNYEAKDWHMHDIRECEEYDGVRNFFEKCGIKDGFDLKHTIPAGDTALYMK